MLKPFLSAAWKKLVLANYAVDAALLQPYLPPGLELDTFNGTCYLSLVGFMFRDTRVMGMKIPYHVNFPEVNLRFYVRYDDGKQVKRGVVFLSEIVPKYAVAFIANTLYKENYRRMPMEASEEFAGEQLEVRYRWKFRDKWNHIAAKANSISLPLQSGTEEEFITEHFWGYATDSFSSANEYQVAHPRWELYPVKEYSIDCDFGAIYGPAFEFLRLAKPVSVFLAEGSAIEVYPKKIIRKIQ
ncbi:DUF2071 domain-containing protein [Pseudoflavitalea sp. G-6-1-2]|uniref:YqjF family protein n=1 Tax=Pseudoflavitalea sp. G-6-1-2 TaxID=2728841 RepID=UPI001469C6B3|nr:DUF2071 domain-containing protein [Pseudoflavitalea sp. G-6-1-2]NML21487.1 DUF2071 domain-containing protein [Pseudoflavitalea sp. G-6-1-2]